MNANKKWLMIAMSLALAGLFIFGDGCKKPEVKAEESVALCTKCGQIKGDELAVSQTRLSVPDAVL